MTKLEKELRRREERRINSINKAESDLAEDALRVLWNVVLIMIGVIIGLLLSASRSQAAETVSIPPRAEYVGVIPTEAQKAPEPPTGATELPLASMPDAEMVEAIGTRWERLGRWKTTGYCPCRRCNGRNAGRTASGAPMTPGRTIAVGGLPFGTVLRVNGQEYVVEDRGTPYGHIDFLYSDHKTASRHGVQYLEVYIKKGE
jgi:3D (Asp-Asp-Asp) domain-containing protein